MKTRFLSCLMFLWAAAAAGQITVNTTDDELNADGDCSFREAMESVDNGANVDGCMNTVNGGPNTIMFSVGGTFATSVQLPALLGADGPLTVDGSGQSVVLSCMNNKMFIVQTDGSLSLSNLSVESCQAAGSGIVVDNTGGDLTVFNVSFTLNGSTSGGQGGVINHSNGSMSLTNANFTMNAADDDMMTMNAGSGEGGAIYISNISAPDAISMTNVTFTSNNAGENGGAIYMLNGAGTPGSISIVGGIFTNNIAGGSGGQDGGGAIWIDNGDSDLVDLVAINQTQFIGNSAPNGAGGAILIPNGARVAYADPMFPALGGIFASHFQSNMAGGNVTGADGGGAIFTRGDLTVVQSSFLGNNTVGGGSGGAIRVGDTSSPDPEIVFANVTFNGNAAEEDGGAIANGNDGIVSLLNTTLSGNDASGSNMTDGGGAIWNANPTAADFTVANSILGDSMGAGDNCAGNAITDGGNNLQFAPDTTSCGATIPIGDPVLNAASIFGGPNLFVFTMEPSTTMTPALGAGNPTVCSDPPVLDFDGTGRVGIRPDGDPNCDIGAHESATLVPVELQGFSVE